MCQNTQHPRFGHLVHNTICKVQPVGADVVPMSSKAKREVRTSGLARLFRAASLLFPVQLFATKNKCKTVPFGCNYWNMGKFASWQLRADVSRKSLRVCTLELRNKSQGVGCILFLHTLHFFWRVFVHHLNKPFVHHLQAGTLQRWSNGCHYL